MAWLIVLGLLALAFGALIYENSRKKHRTAEEYERDAKAGTGLAKAMFGAGLAEVDKAFAPSQAAIHETNEAQRRRKDEAASPASEP